MTPLNWHQVQASRIVTAVITLTTSLEWDEIESLQIAQATVRDQMTKFREEDSPTVQSMRVVCSLITAELMRRGK